MMISQKMTESLNNQLNAELYASYLYLSMAAYFESESLNGFANWMKKQSFEEYEHAMKIFKYLNDVGSKVTLQAIDQPKTEWSGSVEVFENALEHEKKVTKMINGLIDLAIEERDYATNIFLQWFVEEQVEEVSTANGIVDKIKLVGDNKSGLFMLDRELGSRQ